MGVEVRSHKGPERPVMDYPVELVEISKLVPHEQTIEKELQWFMESIQESDELIWPLLIGKNNFTILDGHHRAKGLGRLEFTYAPAIMIDYHDDELITLDTWYPRVKHPVSDVIAVLEQLDLDIVEVDPEEFSRAKLDDREITAFVGNKSMLYQVTGDRESIFKQLRDHWINETIYYDDADMCFDRAEETDTVIISWSYTKEEILEDVRQGIVHLPKTTRHTLKYRVPECHYPLEKLK